MRTFHAIVLALVSSTVTPAIFAQSGSARAQQPAPSPTQPRPLADRATEGAGATIFGNVCGSCHGKEATTEAMSQDMLKQLTPEKLYESMTTGSMQKHADAASSDGRSKSGHRGVGERQEIGLHRKWCRQHHVERVSKPSAGCEPRRAVMERLEPGHDEEQSLPGSEAGRRSGTQRIWTHGRAATPWVLACCGGEAGIDVGVWTAMDVFGVRAADDRGWQGLYRVRFGISLFARCGDGVRALVVPGASGLAQYTDDWPCQARGDADWRRSSATFAAMRTRWMRPPASCCGKRALIPIRSLESPRASRSMRAASTWHWPRSKSPSRRVSTTPVARSGGWLRCWTQQPESKSGRPTRFRKNRRRERATPESSFWDHQARASGGRSLSIRNGRPSMSRRATHSLRLTWAAPMR